VRNGTLMRSEMLVYAFVNGDNYMRSWQMCCHPHRNASGLAARNFRAHLDHPDVDKLVRAWRRSLHVEHKLAQRAYARVGRTKPCCRAPHCPGPRVQGPIRSAHPA
jgi:hypothetical protein